MKDAKEQKLIEAYVDADRKCVEADLDRAEADRKLWEYRVSKAHQGRRAIGRTVDGIVGNLDLGETT